MQFKITNLVPLYHETNLFLAGHLSKVAQSHKTNIQMLTL